MDTNSNNKRSVLICLMLVLATLGVFYQVHSFKFVNYDDHIYVYENPNIQNGITGESIKWAFSSGYAHFWHPLTWLSYMLDWQLFGNNPDGYHITNLLFHIINTLLVFIVLEKMTKAFWQSAFVAALFALHPLHVESVAWVSERKDVLSTFFWLLTMWAYFRYTNRTKILNYLLVVLFFTLGLMAKPMLITLPFVFLLLDYWPLNRINLKGRKTDQSRSLLYLVIEKVPLFAMSLVFSIVAFVAQGRAVKSEGGYTFAIRLANAFISYMRYIVKTVWPTRLTVFCPHPGRNVSMLLALVSAGLLLAATIAVLIFARKRRYLFTGWFWYLGTLVPVIGIIQVGVHAYADRYTYITLTGLFIIVAWGIPDLLAKLPYRKVVLGVSALVVLSALAVVAHLQTRHWKDGITLCQHALKVTRDNYLAHFNMTEILMSQGRFEEAIRHNSEVVRIKPDYVNAINSLGVALCGAGRIDEAVGYFERAIEIDPCTAEAHANLGTIMANRGRFDEAVRHFRAAAQVKDTPDIHSALGSALLRLGRFDEAVREYEEILHVEPQNVGAYNDLGVAFFKMGKVDEAIMRFNQALRIDPNYTPVIDNLKTALAEKQRLRDKAAEDVKE